MNGNRNKKQETRNKKNKTKNISRPFGKPKPGA